MMDDATAFWGEDALARAHFAGRSSVTSADWDPRASMDVRAAFASHMGRDQQSAADTLSVLLRVTADQARTERDGAMHGYRPLNQCRARDVTSGETDVVARVELR